MPKIDRFLLMVSLVVMAAANSPARAATDELFAGVWAETCSHLSGVTYTFHDGNRLKIVDLDCQILGWKRTGNHFRSRLLCTLDGVRQRARIDVERLPERLRITMSGLVQTVRSCP